MVQSHVYRFKCSFGGGYGETGEEFRRSGVVGTILNRDCKTCFQRAKIIKLLEGHELLPSALTSFPLAFHLNVLFHVHRV